MRIRPLIVSSLLGFGISGAILYHFFYDKKEDQWIFREHGQATAEGPPITPLESYKVDLKKPRPEDSQQMSYDDSLRLFGYPKKEPQSSSENPMNYVKMEKKSIVDTTIVSTLEDLGVEKGTKVLPKADNKNETQSDSSQTAPVQTGKNQKESSLGFIAPFEEIKKAIPRTQEDLISGSGARKRSSTKIGRSRFANALARKQATPTSSPQTEALLLRAAAKIAREMLGIGSPVSKSDAYAAMSRAALEGGGNDLLEDTRRILQENPGYLENLETFPDTEALVRSGEKKGGSVRFDETSQGSYQVGKPKGKTKIGMPSSGTITPLSQLPTPQPGQPTTTGGAGGGSVFDLGTIKPADPNSLACSACLTLNLGLIFPAPSEPSSMNLNANVKGPNLSLGDFLGANLGTSK